MKYYQFLSSSSDATLLVIFKRPKSTIWKYKKIVLKIRKKNNQQKSSSNHLVRKKAMTEQISLG